jgi:hypothetical protein
VEKVVGPTTVIAAVVDQTAAQASCDSSSRHNGDSCSLIAMGVDAVEGAGL